MRCNSPTAPPPPLKRIATAFGRKRIAAAQQLRQARFPHIAQRNQFLDDLRTGPSETASNTVASQRRFIPRPFALVLDLNGLS